MSTVTDSFDRANNPLTLGNADTGQTWVPILGSVDGVITNQMYVPVQGTPVGAQPVIGAGAVIDSSMHNIIVQATVASYGNTDIFGRRSSGPRIIGWYEDDLNYLVLLFRTDFQIWTYYEITGGYQTDIHFFNFGAPPIVDGDVMKIVLCEGPPATIELWQNSTQLLGANISHPTPFVTTTVSGLSFQDDSGRFDDFSVIANAACPESGAFWQIPAIGWEAAAEVTSTRQGVATLRMDEGVDGPVPWYIVPQLSDSGNELRSKTLKAVIVTGKLTDAKALGYGYDVFQPVSTEDLENGEGSYTGTVPLPDTDLPTRSERKPIRVPNAVLHTVRIEGIWDGEGDPDRVDEIVYEWAEKGVRR